MSSCAAVGETRILTEEEGTCKQGMREARKNPCRGGLELGLLES